MKTFNRVPLEVAKYPVRIDSVTKDLIPKFKLNSKEGVVKVGIWGIGGMGKTTIARALYNQVYVDFDAASFVSNVRATSAEPSKGLTYLQKQILEELTKYGGTVSGVERGITLFRNHLGGKRVLLVLDDVDDVVQLDALVGECLGNGSRVIITSRDQHIFNHAGVSPESIYEMSGLEMSEGLQLFSWHAFHSASPSPSLEDLSNGIVKACKGHPLSLEVIGSFLHDKQDVTACWTEAMRNIDLIPDIQKKVYNILKISYDVLSNKEREIFLDIACLFIGEDKTLPIVFWDSLYKIVKAAVCNLSMKLLIKIDDEGVFDMHDHLRDLGRTIAKEEKEGTRLWDAKHLSSLSNNNNLSRLRLNGGNPLKLETLYRPGLSYLHLQNVRIEGMTEHTRTLLPETLEWLRLQDCTFEIGKNGAIKKILTATRGKKDHSSNTKQLKIVQLNNCNLRSISPIFSLNVEEMEMQHLDLRGCGSLNKLPNTIGNLSQLQHLTLGWCTRLKKLPGTIGNLSQLRHLDLEGCDRLNKLPDTIGKLSQLQRLNLKFCGRLNNLPRNIGNLSHLQHLDFGGCDSLKELPHTIGNLSQLQHLNLEGCDSLKELPNTIGNLSQLQYLNLKVCTNLNNLPYTIGMLSQLQYLNLERCTRLNKLPGIIHKMSQLQHLHL